MVGGSIPPRRIKKVGVIEMDDIALKTLPKEFYDAFIPSIDVRSIKEFYDAESELVAIPKVTGIKFCIANDDKNAGFYVVLLRCDQLQYDIAITRYPTLEQAIIYVHTLSHDAIEEVKEI